MGLDSQINRKYQRIQTQLSQTNQLQMQIGFVEMNEHLKRIDEAMKTGSLINNIND